MIIQNSKNIRNRIEKNLNKKDYFNKDTTDLASLYPRYLKSSIHPYEKEANIMVNKIRREMKDKHNMTKNKYKFLNRQLWKYLSYTSQYRNDYKPCDFNTLSECENTHMIEAYIPKDRCRSGSYLIGIDFTKENQ